MPITSCAPRLALMKGQAADPGGERATGLKEVLAGLHVALEGKADAQHKHEVQQHDQPIDVRKVRMAQKRRLQAPKQHAPKFTLLRRLAPRPVQNENISNQRLSRDSAYSLCAFSDGL
jgi:hypothetical protein